MAYLSRFAHYETMRTVPLVLGIGGKESYVES